MYLLFELLLNFQSGFNEWLCKSLAILQKKFQKLYFYYKILQKLYFLLQKKFRSNWVFHADPHVLKFLIKKCNFSSFNKLQPKYREVSTHWQHSKEIGQGSQLFKFLFQVLFFFNLYSIWNPVFMTSNEAFKSNGLFA